ncbi:unnamed protein product [Cylicocyclus nassatus]|uniref:Uncharacterized protein n=1 Tax=Cylicocyclus nassatus TaxID=53992 RepID=A0AA36H280_CYLNA|nr:unnamed protein product [Cylicocyclus nassatus]
MIVKLLNYHHLHHLIPGSTQNSKADVTAKTRKEKVLNPDSSNKEDLSLSKFANLRCDDDPELSMLRSIAGDSLRSWDATPSRLARLREHEYEDQSDNEQTTESVWKGYSDVNSDVWKYLQIVSDVINNPNSRTDFQTSMNIALILLAILDPLLSEPPRSGCTPLESSIVDKLLTLEISSVCFYDLWIAAYNLYYITKVIDSDPASS